MAVVAQNAQVIEAFYERLFWIAPELKSMFPADHETQAAKLQTTIQVALNMLSFPDELLPILHKMGAQHFEYGATIDHYQVVAEVLIDTLAENAGETWTQETSVAWQNLLALFGREMLAGAETVQQKAS